ncbi:MAG: hypothetical protein ACP5IA_03435 [Sediminispirochaetaceae bacterium]
MENLKNREEPICAGLFILGGFSLAVALYQNFVLERPYFYALFSLGMFLVLLSLYNRISREMLFAGWTFMDAVVFTIFLLLTCLIIDNIGMRLGYWEYPHYGPADDVRKYFLEWGIALLYHMVSLQVGAKLFQKFFPRESAAVLFSLLFIVTPVGFLTESLNLQVYSWRVISMPFSNLKIGDFFLIFQTIGYWLMALIPYTLYLIVDQAVRRREILEQNI